MKRFLVVVVVGIASVAVGQDSTENLRQRSEAVVLSNKTSRPSIPHYSFTVYASTLPNAPSYQALTADQKFDVFVREAQSPLTFAGAGLRAGYNTALNRSYGNGFAGYRKNFAVAITQRETTVFLGRYLFPTLLDQDPRYHPSRSANLLGRAGYAATRVFITKDDSGKRVVNSSYLLGALASSAISRSYRPMRDRTVGSTLSDFGSDVASDAGLNLVREFWPSIRPTVAALAPKPLKKLTGKIKSKIVGESRPPEPPLSLK